MNPIHLNIVRKSVRKSSKHAPVPTKSAKKEFLKSHSIQQNLRNYSQVTIAKDFQTAP